MPFNATNNFTKNNSLNPNIILTPSKVIELLSICHAFSDDEHKYGKEAYFSYLNDYLTDQDKKTIYDIHKLPFYGLQIILLILKTGEFDSVEAFLEKVNEMSDSEFLYIMSGELLSHDDIETFKNSPDLLTNFVRNNKWIISRKDCSLERLIQNPEDFKTRFINLFIKLNNKKFYMQIDEFKNDYSHARRYINAFLINNQPIDIIVDFRGFDRTKSFKNIIMVPAIMLTPHRTYYFHDEQSLLILYDIDLVKDYTNLQIEKSSEFLKAISDVSKLNILSLLKYNRLCSSELSSILNLTTATISRHIDSLMKFNLMEESKEKNTKFYQLNSNMAFKHFDDVIRLLSLKSIDDDF